MRRLAVLSLHTSPLIQPGSGDAGGMNVYVRELVASLAQAGVDSTVFVRRWADDLAPIVRVEPGFTVVHVPAGPPNMAKEDLPARSTNTPITSSSTWRTGGDVEALHANYWLSGVGGTQIKHHARSPARHRLSHPCPGQG